MEREEEREYQSLKRAVTCLKLLHIRMSKGSRWIVWDESETRWIVYERLPYAKKTREIARCNLFETAILYLEDENE